MSLQELSDEDLKIAKGGIYRAYHVLKKIADYRKDEYGMLTDNVV